MAVMHFEAIYDIEINALNAVILVMVSLATILALDPKSLPTADNVSIFLITLIISSVLIHPDGIISL